jgi:hypothetical protein
MAWESAMEGAIAACLGNAAVGFLAQGLFGFDLSKDAEGSGDNAEALGKAGWAWGFGSLWLGVNIRSFWQGERISTCLFRFSSKS